jgi:large subunit ribosomal protein L28
VLDKKIPIIVSKKAERTIKKMGSFDNYILCTKPKDLDSKYGEYLRELMLRKINNNNFRIPYIIGTRRIMKKKKYDRKLYLK